MRHLQSFRYVKAIAEAGSIRGAAENLAISPSALNRHIQSLEYDLDIQIFERLTRGVRLSPEGEIFYVYALSQLTGYKKLQHEINNIRGLQIGRIDLAITEDILIKPLFKIIGDFQSDNPNVDVEVHVKEQQEIFDGLRDGNIDLALCTNPNLRRGITVVGAKDAAINAFIPNEIKINQGSKVKIHEFNDIRVALPPRGSETSARILGAAERNHIRLNALYHGADIPGYLEHSHHPVVGCFMLIEAPHQPFDLSGYTRIEIDPREIGNLNICLLANEERGVSSIAYKVQNLLMSMLH